MSSNLCIISAFNILAPEEGHDFKFIGRYPIVRFQLVDSKFPTEKTKKTLLIELKDQVSIQYFFISLHFSSILFVTFYSFIFSNNLFFQVLFMPARFAECLNDDEEKMRKKYPSEKNWYLIFDGRNRDK